jgi:hypothetical protein
MKAWIGISVISDNPALINAVENMLPHRLDSRLWDSDEYSVFKDTDTEGNEFINVSLFFNDFSERANFKAAMGGINGFLQTALPGSFVKGSKCWHDELLPNGSPVNIDELEFEEVIV